MAVDLKRMSTSHGGFHGRTIFTPEIQFVPNIQRRLVDILPGAFDRRRRGAVSTEAFAGGACRCVNTWQQRGAFDGLQGAGLVHTSGGGAQCWTICERLFNQSVELRIVEAGPPGFGWPSGWR